MFSLFFSRMSKFCGKIPIILQSTRISLLAASSLDQLDCGPTLGITSSHAPYLYSLFQCLGSSLPVILL